MKPVLILGAGINGAAVARDLVVNGIPVYLVDTGDVAGGATSRSSRLIHGGLRYLEYRDVSLVRESLLERERLLKIAPQFVKPLRLTIPVVRRLGGLWAGLIRCSGLARTPLGRPFLKIGRGPRGLLAIRVGLFMYDWLASSDELPSHRITAKSHHPSMPQADEESIDCQADSRFRWLCSYSDGQIEYPERFVLALLEDARRAAETGGVEFEVLPYHRVVASESSTEISIVPVDDATAASDSRFCTSFIPTTIVNATGAWGDRTLEALGLHEKQIFAGTKGSHLFTTHPPLIAALGGDGIYAEADDGRLVFILPCAGGVLIGTTDESFTDDPGIAAATSDEVDYLLSMVSEVFPGIALTADMVNMHHAGVRPLPKCESDSAAAIPRGHSIEETSLNGVPVLTLVGGKLTTCRSLAEEVSIRICSTLGKARNSQTSDRPVPGANGVREHSLTGNELAKMADQYNLHVDQVAAVWPLVGNRFDEIFADECDATEGPQHELKQHSSLYGTVIPKSFVRWSIDREWCMKLDDLVERRLMLIFRPTIHQATLEELANELVDAGRLKASQIDDELERVSHRLQKFYGKTVATD